MIQNYHFSHLSLVVLVVTSLLGQDGD